MKIPLAHLMLGMGIPQMCIGVYNMEMKVVEVEEGIVHHGNCEDDQTSLENIKYMMYQHYILVKFNTYTSNILVNILLI